MVQVVQPSMVERLGKEQAKAAVVPLESVRPVEPTAASVAEVAPAREGTTVVPLSEAELAKVEQTATVKRPVHWEMVARLVAEVRQFRRARVRVDEPPMPQLVAGRPLR